MRYLRVSWEWILGLIILIVEYLRKKPPDGLI